MSGLTRVGLARAGLTRPDRERDRVATWPGCDVTGSRSRMPPGRCIRCTWPRHRAAPHHRARLHCTPCANPRDDVNYAYRLNKAEHINRPRSINQKESNVYRCFYCDRTTAHPEAVRIRLANGFLSCTDCTTHDTEGI